jgi:phage head maturation protease
MDNLLKQFNEEMKAKLLESFNSEEFISVVKAAKESDAGTFKVIISTDNQDRQGEVVKQDGWDMSNYNMNPVVLWAHDYSSLPIGMTTRIYTEGGKTYAEGKFAPAEANPFAQQVRKLYDGGFVNTTSVGFIPTQMGEKGVILKAELLEYSFVPVPANPYALSVRMVKDWALDLNALATKGLTFNVKADEEKTPKEGDACKLESGEDGKIIFDESGEPQCVAVAEEDKEEKEVKMDDAEADGTVAPAEASEGVADELAESEVQEAKWARIYEFWELTDAFVSAFLDESKTMADWDTLMAEFCTLCQNVPMNEDDENEDGSRKSIVKAFGEIHAKAGKELSGSNAEILKKCVKAMGDAMASHDDAHKESMKGYKPITDALNGMLEKAGVDQDAEDNADDAKKSVVSNGYPAEKTEKKEEILSVKDILKEVTGVMQKSLEQLNAKTKEHAKKI